jgi:type III secretory pathway component EscT
MTAFSAAGAQQALMILALLWSRLAPLFFLAPFIVLGARPSTLALALSIAGALVLMPIALAGTPAPSQAHPALPLAAACGRELLRGSVLALGCALPLAVFASSGSLADALRGAGGADAADGVGLGLTTLYGMAALVLAVLSGWHLPLLQLFLGGLRDTPLGQELMHASATRSALFSAAKLLQRAFEMGVVLSAPLLLGAWAAALVIGLLMRAAHLIALPMAASALWPWLALGAVCLSASVVLDELPSVAQVFLEQTQRLWGAFQ